MSGWGLRALVLAGGCLIACAARGYGQATLVADAHVNAALPTVNSGGISNVNVGGGYTGLFQFDLSFLPAGTTPAQISRAVLVLYANRVDTPGVVSLQPLNADWNEMGVTYQTLPAMGAAVQTANVAQAGAYVAVDVTGMVQGWVGTPATNFGFALTSANGVMEFDSKENDLTGHAATLELTMVSQGPVGPVGPAGSQGAVGAQGSPGVAGATGPAGPAGANGAAGAAGPAGAVGPAGTAGAMGPAGPAGIAGAQGAQGLQGAPGVQGLAGTVGPPGVAGATGIAGPAGATGAVGPAGAVGAAGAAGATGASGAAGAPGAAGPVGPPGSVGPAGPAGANGAAGAQGVAGPVGLSFLGAYGAVVNYAAGDGVMYGGAGYVSLVSGNHGNTPDESPAQWALFAAAGATGAPGAAGAVGAAGPAGPTGAQGPVGATGVTGPQGLQGPAVVNYRGNYGSTTNYGLADAVSYDGSTYVSLVAGNHGNTPDQSAADWAVLAAQGVAGPTGATGAAGAAGLPGATGPAGATGLPGPPATFLGEWLVGTAYAVGSAVSYGGGSYVALAGNTGREPDVSPSYWGVLAQGGSVGPAGPAGATGATGDAGYPGPAGAIGPAGPVGAAGPAGLNYRGGYSGNAVYGVGDAVTFDGASYISLTTGNMGNSPGSQSGLWGVLAAAGAAGADGAQGLAGPVGAAGAAGPAGPVGPAGAVGVNFRGAWGSGPSYAVSDAVTFGGSTYLATAANSAVEPDLNASLWTVIAAAGSAGPSGAVGTASTVQVGTVTTGAPGSNAAVANAGTSSAVVLNFTIPQGATGVAGTSGSGGAPVGGFASMVHAVSYVATYYAVNNTNQNVNEVQQVLTWVPNGCTATQLTVFSEQGATITVTLRVGTIGGMADSALSCQVATGGSCTVNGSVAVPAGGFIDLGVTHSDSTAAGVWTALTCN